VIFVSRSNEVPAPLRSKAAATARARATRFYRRPPSLRLQEGHTFDRRIYAAPVVLKALQRLFSDKCAYCESPPGNSQRALVDQFRPTAGALDTDGSYHVDHYWWLAYEWQNLLLVCPDCARMKGARFPVQGARAEPGAKGARLQDEDAELLDPCADDPGSHLVYTEDGYVASGTARGRATIETLSLNRWWLVLARADALKAARAGWERAEAAIRKHTKTGDRALQALMSPAAPYAGIRQQFVMQWLDEMTGVEGVTTELAPSQARFVGVVVGAQQQELTRELFEQFDRGAKSYTLAADRGEEADSYYMTARMIRRVEIRNFRIIRRLDFDFPEPKDAVTPWLMLLGENGHGKSSILHAITLALMGDDYRSALGIDPRSLVSWGADRGSVSVSLTGGGEPIELSFSRDSKRFECSTPEPKVLLMAYGATRLLPHRHDRVQQSLERRDGTRFANVDNLFDPFVALNEPASWLLGLDEARFGAVARALKRLLPLRRSDRFVRSSGEVLIETFGSRLRLNELSDGYQSVLALATDMMQVLVHRWPAVDVAEGIVAIDEIEAHLHPSWRMRIVGSLREVFPRLQFLATTHEPLCLRGLHDGEVMVMRRGERSNVFGITDLPSVKGLRVDQLLTSEIFGLDSTSDPEIDDLLTEYRNLRWRRSGSARAKKRQDELRRRLDELQVLGRDARERLMLEAADQYLVQERKLVDPAQRRELRNGTKRRIAEIFADETAPGHGGRQ
jgi:uncharacterized protein (TIGR02646 family)